MQATKNADQAQMFSVASRSEAVLSKLSKLLGSGSTSAKIEKLLGNCDIYLDKIDRFGENQKVMQLKASKKVEIKPSQRPQATLFKNAPENSADLPFVPILKSKPHGIAPISQEIVQAQTDPIGFFSKVPNPSEYEFPHPYAPEISALNHASFASLVRLCQDIPKSSSFLFADSEEQLQEVLRVIQKAKLLSFDLEHHSEHSFLGFTCLLQLSVPGHDFIIDALLLRDKINLLAPVFADPSVLKIAHGAFSDVQWLQRDFGIYVVNLLDTSFLSKKVHSGSNALGSLI